MLPSIRLRRSEGTWAKVWCAMTSESPYLRDSESITLKESVAKFWNSSIYRWKGRRCCGETSEREKAGHLDLGQDQRTEQVCRIPESSLIQLDQEYLPGIHHLTYLEGALGRGEQLAHTLVGQESINLVGDGLDPGDPGAFGQGIESLEVILGDGMLHLLQDAHPEAL